MNNLQFILFAAVTAACLTFHTSGAAPTEFADVPWGASPEVVRQVIGKRPEVVFSAETPEQITFTGGTFAGELVANWRFEFTASKFRSGTVALMPMIGKDAKGFLNDQIEWRILRLLDQKYGNPKKVDDANHREYNWKFTDPLHPKDIKAIKLFHGWAPTRRIEVTYSQIFAAPAEQKAKDDI